MSCPDPFSTSPYDWDSAIPEPADISTCRGQTWLTYAILREPFGNDAIKNRPVVARSAYDLQLLPDGGCYTSPGVLCQSYCTLAVYADTGRDIAFWEIVLSLVGLLVLLTTLLLLCALRLRRSPNGRGRLATVRRQLLAAYCAYYTCRTVRLLAWPAVRCLGRAACLTLDAAGELLETTAYGGLFAAFLAHSVCLRLRLGQRRPAACQSPPRRERPGDPADLLTLAWPLPIGLATGLLACRAFVPGQLVELPTFEALMRLRADSYYTAVVRLPLAAVQLVSLLLGLQSLRLSMMRRDPTHEPPRRRHFHQHRRRQLRRWVRTLALINAMTGAYLLLDLLPPGLAPDPRALRCAQLGAHLLQSLLVTLPMFWLNRRLRRSARRQLFGASVVSRLGLLNTSEESAVASPARPCRLVAFLPAQRPSDMLEHLDCEIDS